MSTFSVSGLASGMDTEGIISKLLAVEKKPLLTLEEDQAAVNDRLPILEDINVKMLELKSLMSDLTYETPFSTKKISSSSTSVSATVNSANLSTGSYVIDSITKIASSSVASSLSSVGASIDPTAKLSSSIPQSITTGVFSINNVQISVDSSTDSLNDVLAKINSSTSDTGVKATYDSTTDKIILENAVSGNKNAIIAGAANDTSNFLSAAGLSSAFQDTSTGVTKMSSVSHLGAIDPAKTINELKFDKSFTGGKIKINGVEISVSSGDTINQVISNINSSNAGVTAAYDSSTDRIKFTSKNTGASYIKFEEVSGGSNFLELIGITGTKSSSSISTTSGSVGLTDTLSDADLKTAASAGTFKISHGGASASISFDATTTMQQLVDSINNSAIQVSASYDPANGKFYIKPNANSDPNLTFTDENGGNLTSVLNLPSSVQNQTIGSNAEYRINGVTHTSNSNVISDKFDGISFTLTSTSTSSVTLSATNDSSVAKENIEKFVKSYNEILTELNKQISDEKGPLYKDSTLVDMLSSMRKMANGIAKNGTSVTSLSDIGITTGSIGMQMTKDYIGKLEIDSTKLKTMLESNPNDVRKLFAYSSDNTSKSTDGIAYNFKNYLDSLTKVGGTINKVIEINNEELTRITTNITEWNARLKLIETGFKEKFSAMEVAIGKLQRQSDSLSKSLAQLSSS